MTLSLDTAYRSFGGEVEASSTPTICRLSDSRRHQLAAIAPDIAAIGDAVFHADGLRRDVVDNLVLLLLRIEHLLHEALAPRPLEIGRAALVARDDRPSVVAVDVVADLMA